MLGATEDPDTEDPDTEDPDTEEFSEEVRKKALEFFEGLQIECKKTHLKAISNYMVIDKIRKVEISCCLNIAAKILVP